MKRLIGILFCFLVLSACDKDTEHITFLFRIDGVDAGETHAHIHTSIYGPGRVKVAKILANLDTNFDFTYDTSVVVMENFETVGPITFTLNDLTPGTSYNIRLEAHAHGHPIFSNEYTFSTLTPL